MLYHLKIEKNLILDFKVVYNLSKLFIKMIKKRKKIDTTLVYNK